MHFRKVQDFEGSSLEKNDVSSIAPIKKSGQKSKVCFDWQKIKPGEHELSFEIRPNSYFSYFEQHDELSGQTW